MKKSLWINAGLFAAIVALALFAWFKPSGSEPAHRLSTLKAAEVKSLQVIVAGAPPISLEREAAGWAIAAPFTARADRFQVQRLLELLDAKSNERFAAAGLARYGLNEPYARIVIDRQEFSFGAFNEMSREQYVLTANGVFLLPPRYAAALPKSPLNLVSKQLFTADEAPVGFDFGSFKVEQSDGKWTLTMTSSTLPAAEAGADDINRWVDDWRLASALGVQGPTQRKPVGALKVTLKDGRDVLVKIIERGANTVVARSDEPFEYLLSAETGARLLMPPGTIAGAAPAPAAAPAK